MYSIKIFRDDFVFSSGHIMIYGENLIEASHGHNYKVELEIFGELNEYGLLIDFREIKKILKDLIEELNQNFLIPQNKDILVEENDSLYDVYYRKEKIISLKKEIVVLLNISNISSENLCLYFTNKIIKKNIFHKNIQSFILTIKESYGQKATYRHTFK